MKYIVYLGLGTNMGDRLAHLQSAREALSPQVEVLEASPIYETEPWGYLDQPDFLNQVLKCTTDLAPVDLLSLLKKLEADLGRKPTFRNGPRPIDIDILFIDHLIMSDGKLELPHPRIDERTFVLVPLADLAPDLLHPILGRTIRELKEAVDCSGVRLFALPE